MPSIREGSFNGRLLIPNEGGRAGFCDEAILDPPRNDDSQGITKWLFIKTEMPLHKVRMRLSTRHIRRALPPLIRAFTNVPVAEMKSG
jgi:hypothetical protein